MATTDLSSKSLGDISLESGIGAPDHTSVEGSTYVNKDDGFLYLNHSGATWDKQVSSSHASLVITDNTVNTGVGTVLDGWYVANIPISAQTLQNFTLIGEELYLDSWSGYNGYYDMTASMTLEYVSGGTTQLFEAGLSVDDFVPFNSLNGVTLSATYPVGTVKVSRQAYLSGGTFIQLAVSRRGSTAGNNVLIKHVQITVKRVK